MGQEPWLTPLHSPLILSHLLFWCDLTVLSRMSAFRVWFCMLSASGSVAPAGAMSVSMSPSRLYVLCCLPEAVPAYLLLLDCAMHLLLHVWPVPATRWHSQVACLCPSTLVWDYAVGFAPGFGLACFAAQKRLTVSASLLGLCKGSVPVILSG